MQAAERERERASERESESESESARERETTVDHDPGAAARKQVIDMDFVPSAGFFEYLSRPDVWPALRREVTWMLCLLFGFGV